jgi:transposase
MSDDIRSLLGLHGYRVLEVAEEDDDAVVHVEPPAEAGCTRCGVVSARVHARSPRTSRILWAFLDGRRLWVTLRRRRHWCLECGRAFTARLPGVAPRARMSVGAQVALLSALRELSFAALARSHGVSYGQARRALLRLPVPWCDWALLVGGSGPISLGVDEHSFRGRDLVLTISCLSSGRLVAILPDRRLVTLRGFLRALPVTVRARIAGACIDLTAGYRSVLRDELPRARIVADRFHVIADANKRLDETRRLEGAEAGESLPRWPLLKGEERLTPRQAGALAELRARYPTIAEQHWCKERLRELYDAPDRRTAEARWTRLLVVMEASDDAAVLQWARTLRRWRKEILGYFELPITNGFTEGCHTKIKLLKRLSYGYRNVQVYLRKMLLGFLPTDAPALRPHLSS